jgi:hypothetical protein
MKNQTFADFLVAYRQRTGATLRQIAVILAVSIDTVKSWSSGRNIPRDESVYMIELSNAEHKWDFDNLCVWKFSQRSGWTLNQVAVQFNAYEAWRKVTVGDIMSWIKYGLPNAPFKWQWPKSRGQKPKTEADYIRKRFREMESEVFSLIQVNKNGVWDWEDAEDFEKRLAKGPKIMRIKK